MITLDAIRDGVVGIGRIPTFLDEFIIDFLLEAAVETFEDDGFVEDIALGEFFDIDGGFVWLFEKVVLLSAPPFLSEG